jgi:outer membrane protein OmpA-like peptidoglycan-associated protein
MKIAITPLLVLLFWACQPSTANAQFDILDKVKDKIQQKAEEKTDEAIDKAVDKGAEEIEKKATEKKQDSESDDDGASEKVSNQKNSSSKGKNSSMTDGKPSSTEVSLKSYSKYDFIPGDKVLFFEDFSQDNVGDFPAKWNTNGSGEVVTLNKYPGKWLKAKNGSLYVPDFPKPFPENYTIEFDLIFNGVTDSQLGNINIFLIASNGSKEYLQHPYAQHNVGKSSADIEFTIAKEDASRFNVENYSENDTPFSSDLTDKILNGKFGKIVRVSMSIQKQRFRVWFDGKKIYDLPKFIPKDIYDIFKIGLWYFDDQNEDSYEVYFSNLRFAAGLPDMRSKLLTEGKLVTHGINFDVNSDKIRPDSYGTLKEIANILKENSEVRVKIVGHTDSDGADAANMDLSKRRADAVKNALSSEFSIVKSRLEAAGKGESEPIADNATTEGKANNRRVEFIKL